MDEKKLKIFKIQLEKNKNRVFSDLPNSDQNAKMRFGTRES